MENSSSYIHMDEPYLQDKYVYMKELDTSSITTAVATWHSIMYCAIQLAKLNETLSIIANNSQNVLTPKVEDAYEN